MLSRVTDGSRLEGTIHFSNRGGEPFIEQEAHTLVGETKGGADIAIGTFGYVFTYEAIVEGVTVSEHRITDGCCKTLIKLYRHDLMLKYERALVMILADEVIDLADIWTMLTQTCCE